VLELNSAEVALTQAKLTYTQAIYDYLTAKADLEKLQGKDYVK
jgi:outer membrane protein TolC